MSQLYARVCEGLNGAYTAGNPDLCVHPRHAQRRHGRTGRPACAPSQQRPDITKWFDRVVSPSAMTSAGFSITRDGTARIGSDSDRLDGKVAGMVDVFHHRRSLRPLLARTGDVLQGAHRFHASDAKRDTCS
jgi:hypothetical protein